MLMLVITLTACGNKTGNNGGGDNGGGGGGNNNAFVTTPPAPKSLKPQLAIVYSKTSEKNFWTPKSYSQLFMSVQSQAMMAGLPYDVLNEDDLLDINKISHYKTLLFPLFSYAKSDKINQIAANLKTAIEQHNVGIITAGNFLTNTETGDSLSGDAYVYMKDLLGLARVDGAGPVDIKINISNANHPALANEYTQNETVLSYTKSFTDYFTSTGAYPSNVIATQQINNSQIENELITITHNGRHAHFATVQALADGNLLWPILQWSVFGEKTPVSLQMGRKKALFISRNDMDQSMFASEVSTVEIPLLNQLKLWKERYGFVGSYYINIGNRPAEDEFTDWGVSAPLYQQYIQRGNEIGSHSYTHPADTNTLTTEQIKFQFADARTVIEKEMGLTHTGAAVPGNPENLITALQTIAHVDYLSGGYSAVGAGFANAFGFLNADSTKVYLSPNMSFDFTLVQFQKRSAAEAKQIWLNEFDALAKHASHPMMHWPWHDYGPNDTFKTGYTLDMYEGLIAKAKNFGSEFITGKNFAERIKTFKQSAVDITTANNVIIAKVKSQNAGQFALKLKNKKSISSVDRWYAYNNDSVFLDQDGGVYTVHLGTPRSVTHINQLPSRSKLIALSGNGEDIKFRFNGEGKVEIITKCINPSAIKITGGISAYQTISNNRISLNFSVNKAYAETTVDITCP
jgi:peptidoglycan/xylan/chitin deacetylase (PgdA/CDA1 family)